MTSLQTIDTSSENRILQRDNESKSRTVNVFDVECAQSHCGDNHFIAVQTIYTPILVQQVFLFFFLEDKTLWVHFVIRIEFNHRVVVLSSNWHTNVTCFCCHIFVVYYQSYILTHPDLKVIVKWMPMLHKVDNWIDIDVHLTDLDIELFVFQHNNLIVWLLSHLISII